MKTVLWYLILTTSICQEGIAESLNCSDLLFKDCSCNSPTTNYTMIKCPGRWPVVEIKIDIPLELEIEYGTINFASVSGLKVGPIEQLKITSFITSNDYSIKNLYEVFGITRINKIKLSLIRESTLSEHFLKGLNEVEELVLEDVIYNLTIHKDAFADMKRLKKLKITRFGTLNLPGSTLSSAKSLTYFSADYGILEINDVNTGLFSNLKNLETVKLQRCIPYLHENTFFGSKNLKELVLNKNIISKLDTSLLIDQVYLETLDLSSNRIAELPKGLLVNTSRLKWLDLSRNQLRQVPQDMFENCLDLTFLDLSFNQIKEITLDTFFYLPSLKQFDIRDDYNTTRTNEALYTALPQEVEIKLNDNEIKEIKFDENKFEDLIKVLYSYVASGHDIRFKHSIYLGGNDLKCGCNLMELFMILFNQRYRYSKSIFDIRDSFILQCRLNDLKNGTSQQVNILSSFTSCKAKQCPDYCNCRYNFQDEKIVYNCTNFIPTSVLTTKVVRHFELRLKGEHLEEVTLPEDKRYSFVTHIILSNIKLKRFQMSQSSMYLKKLDISSNNITMLTEETVRYLEHSPALREMILENNSWKCDCELLPLFRLLKYNVFEITSLERTRCANGTLFRDLHESSLCLDLQNSPNPSLLVFVVFLCIVICIDTLAIFLFFYIKVCRHKLKNSENYGSKIMELQKTS